MRFYSMSYVDTLALPIRTFWSLFAQIRRIRAQENKPLLDVMIAHHSKEGVKTMSEYLEREIGEPIKKSVSSEFDASGWEELRRMQHQRF